MKFPNLLNLFMAGCRVVKAKFFRQAVMLDQASVDERLAACAKCSFFDPEAGQCRVCTCLVELKAQLATEKCPKGRWSVTNS